MSDELSFPSKWKAAPPKLAEEKPDPDATAPITIEISVTLDLSPDEVWPDGDWPENWEPEDVVKVVEESGTAERFFRDWNWASSGAEVSVHAKGRYMRGWLR